MCEQASFSSRARAEEETKQRSLNLINYEHSRGNSQMSLTQQPPAMPEFLQIDRTDEATDFINDVEQFT